MKYYIVPKNEIAMEINANIMKCESAADAMSFFAINMDSDMNTYFEAVSENDWAMYQLKRTQTEEKRIFLEFAEDVLEEDFDDIEEDDIPALAEYAWELYCGERKGGEGLTEYECIEKAVDDNYETIEEEE